MRSIRAWIRRLATLFTARDAERDMSAELESHLLLHIDDNLRRGIPPAEARRRAVLALGGLDQAKEQYRDRSGLPLLGDLARDVRHGLRAIRRHSGFSAAAVITLALGLGANLAIFRFVHAVLIDRLHVLDPERLVAFRPRSFSYPEFRAIAAATGDILTHTAARWSVPINVTIDGATDYLPAELVSGSYFPTLGLTPVAGRLLDANDDGAEGAHRVCVIGYRLWQRRFNGDPAVVGRTLELNRERFEIVGVTPRGFDGSDLHAHHDLQVPMSMTLLFTGMERDSHGWSWLSVIGRLAPGVSRSQAEAVVRATVRAQQGPVSLEDARQGLSSLRRRLENPVLVAQMLSGCVLLAACANLAGLLLARSSARRHEIAVRRSLGASRRRIVVQLMIETLMIAGAAGLVGTAIASALDRIVVSMLLSPGTNTSLSAPPALVSQAVSFALLVLVALAVGLLPAVAAVRETPLDGLRDAPRVAQGPGWLGRGLIVGQVVLSLVLMFAAALFARSLHNLRAIDLGLDAHQVVVLTADPERSGYSRERAIEFSGEWLRRARSVPGVTSAALAGVTAMSGSRFAGLVTVADAVPRGGSRPNNNFNMVSPDYFRTLGLPIVAGRVFTDADRLGARRVAIVNERFVEHYWPGAQPIGRTVVVFRQAWEIVGVARTAKYTDIREDPQIVIYFPLAQRPLTAVTLHARLAGDTDSALAALARIARDIDPIVPAYDASTLRAYADAGMANERVLGLLSMVFGGLSLMVSCSGIYGLVSYTVARRTREIGIRLAVGAQRRDVLRLFVRDAAVLVAVGIAVGIPLALSMGRQAAAVLYGVDSTSTPTLAGAASILATVAIIAAVIPASRAMRVDPVGSLRVQ